VSRSQVECNQRHQVEQEYADLVDGKTCVVNNVKDFHRDLEPAAMQVIRPIVRRDRRALKLTTTYTHLAQGIEEGELELAEAVSLTPEEVRAIERAFRHGMQDAPFALKPVFDAFDGQNDYGVLRCVRAAMASREPNDECE
jgi:hypothetical protein